ncbi:MAG: hypothetical protein ACRCYD_06435, partial [Plesiomonas sp.]
MAIRASTQLASRQLDWTFSTTELFTYFANEPWSILLDSANAPHQDAKFDIICASPIATLVTQGTKSEIKLLKTELSLPEPLDVHDDPFCLLKQVNKHWYPEALACHFPFSGG